ncbi:L-threonylcarbamoyladenylate synthase [Streptococcus sanguinis]|uniref:L-threonylcarbamoyladenylate synthase n=1 Tax=Streptococcus sanguinis TaxID=1305 RepID=A0A3R9GMJ6_STRSA|nr:L-threonylcarbamoyladenylate synthase [Streptococcus sanguinis]KAA0119625.1 threonylcarbamoyl-AMP synthase [Streptococcus sanguinis]RSI07514.1 Threonylcarbamoyl-AMP synthase [Streptococcus sanguinis]RSI29832.1 Threonylcarbamoyl-AMP synthase [Streptococcus sanguinis]
MDKIEKTLAAGGAVVLPTETVYGLFAQALNEEAVERVYELKRRPRDKALNLNVASLEEIYAFSKNQPCYLEQLYQAFLPGPLTVILQANDRVPAWINSGMETVGFRIPNHPVTLDLIRKYGPLIGPSANLSGKVSGTSFQQIVMDFQEQVSGVEEDAALTGQDSTILDLSGEKALILRQGAITREDIINQVNGIKF